MAVLRSVAIAFLCCGFIGAAQAATDDDPFAPSPSAQGSVPTPPTGTAPSTPSAAAPTAPPATAPGAANAAAPTTPARLLTECEGVNLTDVDCRNSNGGLLAKSAGYVLLCVLLFSILRMAWNRRGTSSAGVRFILPLLFSGAAAGTLVGLDPLRSRLLTCCIANPDFVATVHFQDSEVARAVLFGVLPAMVVYLVVAVVEKLVKR